MCDEQWQQERWLALEEWESAVSAYAAEAARHITTGLAAAITGVPAPRAAPGSPERLLALRVAEAQALGRWLALADGGSIERGPAAAGGLVAAEPRSYGEPDVSMTSVRLVTGPSKRSRPVARTLNR